MNAEQIVTFDHIRIAFLYDRREPLQRVSLGFLEIVWVDNDQFLPAAIVGQ